MNHEICITVVDLSLPYIQDCGNTYGGGGGESSECHQASCPAHHAAAAVDNTSMPDAKQEVQEVDSKVILSS